MDAESNWLKKNPVEAVAETNLDPSLDPKLDPDLGLGLVPGLNLVLGLEAVLLPEIEDSFAKLYEDQFDKAFSGMKNELKKKLPISLVVYEIFVYDSLDLSFCCV